MLPCDPAAPRSARAAFRGLPAVASVRDDAVLVVSELVANAVIHSGCAPEETVAVQAFLGDRCVRIVVEDPGWSSHEPLIPTRARPHGGGLGLRVVQRIAQRWGVERRRGRIVWAELAL